MRRCPNCGKKFTGRATKIYCGASCKTAAFRSRKRQQDKSNGHTLTTGEKADLQLIRERSEGAYTGLMNIRAMYGVDCFKDAFTAVYDLFIDITAPEV